MPILFGEDPPRFLLRCARMSYGLGVDPGGILRNLHFGPALPGLEDLPEPEWGPGSASFSILQRATWREYPAWGGLYYSEPCLKATFADGVRDTRLVYDGHVVDEEAAPRLEIALRDEHYPLLARLLYQLHEGPGLVERRVVLENVGEEPIVLEQALSACWHLPKGPGYRLTHLAGRWVGETRVYRQEVTPGKKVFESRRGHTSHHANPWFAVDRGAADEEWGEVWFGTLAWSGNWKLVVESDTEGLTSVSGGINDFDFSWRLEAEESFETPAFVAGYTPEGFGEASRALHRYVRESVLPKEPTGPRPVLYNSWEATYFDVSEEGQVRLAEKAASIGIELFVVDDGWFGGRDDDTAGLGDWKANPKKFPRGLDPLIEKVRSLGMSFGLWVEPEMTNPDSDLYRAHPDWVYHFPTRPRTQSRNQLVLNLAKDEVKEHVFGVLDGLLSEQAISFVKWDMNRPFSEPGWPEAPAGRQREVWVRHVRGLYEILGRLREKHLDVAVESCSGGGGRVDLGILRYSDQVWTSDNTDPYDRLFIQEGFSMAYPARTMVCWVADPGKWVKNREATLSYRFHSAMMGSLGIGGNLAEWPEKDLAEARCWIERYKEIRDIVQGGDQYRLLSPREGDTSAVQYVSPDKARSVVFALRHPHRFLDPTPKVRLRGLKEGTVYRVNRTPEHVSGASLMSRGVDLPLAGDFASAVISLEETGGV